MKCVKKQIGKVVRDLWVNILPQKGFQWHQKESPYWCYRFI